MRFPALIAVPAIALALAGCSAQEPATQPITSTEVKPLFSSDEEALAAAEAAYANYLQVSDQIARDGGANPERLKGLVSSKMYESEISTLESFSQNEIVMTGQTIVDSVHLQVVKPTTVSIYLCLDTSSAELSNPKGTIEKTSPSRWPLLVQLGDDGSGNLVLEESQTWSGTNFC
jgi:hypothetical protein